MNCWKPKSKDKVISSLASHEEGSETIPVGGVRYECSGSVWPQRNLGDDIVQSL